MFGSLANPLSLYMHIPMCNIRCNYCGFYSEPLTVWQPHRKTYAERLIGEVTALTPPLGGFHTLYIGGGSPLSLGVQEITTLLKAAQATGTPKEVTLEVNPEQVDEGLLSLCATGLITRVSVGIQSMDDTLLALLGRSTTAAQNRSALVNLAEARKKHGIDISVDLMVALPTQSIEGAIADLDSVLSLVDAEHISIYCLSVEEGTALAAQVAAKEVLIHSDDSQAAFLLAINAALIEYGFTHYEVSNWAKNQQYSRHNSVYWALENYIGLGSSAASTVDNQHWEQVQDLITYAHSPPFSGYEREETTLVERIEEYLMMGVRTMWGIDKNIFEQRFGIPFDRLFSTRAAHLESAWYTDTEQLFSLTEDGWFLLDEILLRLILQIPESLDPYLPL